MNKRQIRKLNKQYRHPKNWTYRFEHLKNYSTSRYYKNLYFLNGRDITPEVWKKIRPRILKSTLSKSGFFPKHDLEGQMKRSLSYGETVGKKYVENNSKDGEHTIQELISHDFDYYKDRWCCWRVGVMDYYMELITPK